VKRQYPDEPRDGAADDEQASVLHLPILLVQAA
jgi:hypothetical protein